MPNNYRVIQCPVGELADRLNEMSPDFQPYVWNFSPDIPTSTATIVLMRAPRQQMQIAVPVDAAGRLRQ
jgi:hypothetical protein